MNSSSKLVEPKDLRFIADWSEVQVTAWTCDWHLKWRGNTLGNWALNLWNLTLSPVSVRTELHCRTLTLWCREWHSSSVILDNVYIWIVYRSANALNVLAQRPNWTWSAWWTTSSYPPPWHMIMESHGFSSTDHQRSWLVTITLSQTWKLSYWKVKFKVKEKTRKGPLVWCFDHYSYSSEIFAEIAY